MRYSAVKDAVFLERPNRFIAHVLIDGKKETVHVRNTGRCKEILKPGTEVILEPASNKERKTRYSIIAAYKGNMLINIDSQIPNAVIFESIKQGKIISISNIIMLKKEAVFGGSRFDLYFETDIDRGFIEVKGVTLERDGIGMFPDAPTVRGTKHVLELIKAVEEGYRGIIVFLVQMKGISLFTPNRKMDPDFCEALIKAKCKGVEILAYDSIVTENEIYLGEKLAVMV